MAAEDVAEELHEQAIELSDQGRDDEALELYRQALELDYARPTTHYNIGLIYKYRGEWELSQRHNQFAVDFDPEDEASNWNLAIAATARRDWRTARATWQRLGMNIEPGDTPIEADFGMTPVRLNPEENPEVVWARRIDPVRARVLNIPYGESGYCYGDIVLHDGAAVGYREHNGREYPVFNVLELFEASPNSTYEVELEVAAAADVSALLALLDERGIAAEEWRHSVRALCKQCSEGHPHEHHAEQQETADETRRLIAIAGPDESTIRQTLDAWASAERRLLRIERVLGADEFEAQ